MLRRIVIVTLFLTSGFLAGLVLTRAGGNGCVREFCDAVWNAKRAA